MVARVVRDDEVAGSNPVTPTATALVPLGTRAVLLFRGLSLFPDQPSYRLAAERVAAQREPVHARVSRGAKRFR